MQTTAPTHNRAEQFIASVDPESLEGDLVGTNHPLFGLVWINPDRLGGEPCFAGTRVPIKTLFDHLEAGDTLDEFLADFPGIGREMANEVLERSQAALLSLHVQS